MRHLGRWSVPLLVAFALSASCAEEAGPPTDRFELTGRVTELDTGNRVRGARVRFVSDTLYEATTTTDEDGRYEMLVDSDVPLGRVIAEKPGFEPATVSVFFDTASRRVDVELRTAPAGM